MTRRYMERCCIGPCGMRKANCRYLASPTSKLIPSGTTGCRCESTSSIDQISGRIGVPSWPGPTTYFASLLNQLRRRRVVHLAWSKFEAGSQSLDSFSIRPQVGRPSPQYARGRTRSIARSSFARYSSFLKVRARALSAAFVSKCVELFGGAWGISVRFIEWQFLFLPMVINEASPPLI